MTSTIVLSPHAEQGAQECGIVVDAVADVVDIARDAIRPAPEMGGQGCSKFVKGLAMVGERTLILLDSRCLSAHGTPAEPSVAAAA